MKPHASPLLGCAAHALLEQAVWHVNQPAQLALARKSGEPEAQTCALLGKPQRQRLANDMLRVLWPYGAWALGASPIKGGVWGLTTAVACPQKGSTCSQ